MQLEERALEACQRTRGDWTAGAQRLRAVCDAGRLLDQVKRTPGVRTSSGKPTSFQSIVKAAGICRDTAYSWITAGRVPDDFREAHITAVEAVGGEVTLGGLLNAWQPKSIKVLGRQISVAKFTSSEWARFAHQLDVLKRTVYGTADDSATIVAAVDRVYSEVLKGRCERVA